MRAPPSVTRFELGGRIALRVDQTRHYANISWRHTSDQDDVLLTTPLGQGVAELSRDAAGARLRTADGAEYAAADWEGLADRLFGARLPLNDLPRWVTGHPPDAASSWRVDYLEYQSAAEDALPTLLEIRGSDIELRLKVNEWSLVQ